MICPSAKKKRYALPQDANRAIQRMSGGGVTLRAYTCTHCLGWHLTSKPFDPTRKRGRK